jgi:SIR2-like domain
MTRILLTAAGFSKNWGGLVASEFFSRLIAEQLDKDTRALLFKHRSSGGFETVMSILQGAHNTSPTKDTEERLNNFTGAVLGIFNGMNNVMLREQFEFDNDVAYSVRAFLERFDAIFTLNQDALLEALYIPSIVAGRWGGVELPGTKAFGPPPHVYGAIQDRISPRTSDMPNYRINPRLQPYFKLHGSANWRIDSQSGPLLILGGEKALTIQLHPLLIKYHEEFRTYLSRGAAKLMIIGYGFNDGHINEAIGNAVDGGLELFIVDPRGIDAFDKFDKTAAIPGPPDPYAERLRPSIIGESTKALSVTFGHDRGEHAYLHSFFK